MKRMDINSAEKNSIDGQKHHDGHGYGIKTIKRIIESYGGLLTNKQENNHFEIQAFIPLKKTQPV